MIIMAFCKNNQNYNREIQMFLEFVYFFLKFS